MERKEKERKKEKKQGKKENGTEQIRRKDRRRWRNVPLIPNLTLDNSLFLVVERRVVYQYLCRNLLL